MSKNPRDRTQQIIFTDVLGVAEEYKPRPTKTFIPKWYKETEATYEDKSQTLGYSPTIKKCIPILDTLTTGYIIPLFSDLVYKLGDEHEPDFFYHTSFHALSWHSRKQVHKHPKVANSEFRVPKITNPWSIKTPKGISCLILPPLNNPNPYLEILPAIVDTDMYDVTINFPFTMKENVPYGTIIPAGTPIVQVIPFLRQKWEMVYRQDEMTGKNNNRLLLSKWENRYKRLFWQRKEFF